MAILVCKECGGKVSDKANTCPHCGAPVSISLSEIPKTIICPECGQVVDINCIECPGCGYPFKAVETNVESALVNISINKTANDIERLRSLARQAREISNSKNAEEYYRQWHELEPQNWEPFFYNIYFQCHDINVGEIPNAITSLCNCFRDTLQMVKNDNKDIGKNLNMILSDLNKISDTFNYSTQGFDDHAKYVGQCLFMIDMFGNEIEYVFGGTQKKISAKAWKSAMAIYNAVLSIQMNDYLQGLTSNLIELQGFDGRNVIAKISNIEPQYVSPVKYDRPKIHLGRFQFIMSIVCMLLGLYFLLFSSHGNTMGWIPLVAGFVVFCLCVFKNN